MPLSGLIATSEYAPESRYRRRERRAGQDRAVPAAPAAVATPPADSGFDAAYFASRFKTDLTQLRAFEGADEADGRVYPEDEPGLAHFFGNLSTLLVAVRAGDIERAQAAADALELDALVERNVAKRPGASAPLLGDLVGLLGATHASSATAARVAARELANDFTLAPVPPPIAPPDAYTETPSPDDGGAVYDTLRHFHGGETGVV